MNKTVATTDFFTKQTEQLKLQLLEQDRIVLLG